MSTTKFASVTTLLVRKGEAAPSRVGQRLRLALNHTQSDPPSEGKFVFSPDEASIGDKDYAGEKPRRIVLHLTPHEYETLGLVAVKKGVTRHDLAQSAMTAYFEWLVSEYGEACSCVVGGALCRSECDVEK